jgi:hypothetical protein
MPIQDIPLDRMDQPFCNAENLSAQSLPPASHIAEISFSRRGNSLRSIWAKIFVGAPDECWPWTGYVIRGKNISCLTVSRGLQESCESSTV